MSIDATAVARALGVTTAYKNLRQGSTFRLPQRIAVVAQGATASTFSTTKWSSSNPLEVAARFGFGSPLHLISMMLYPINGDGVGTIPVTFYPLDDHASGVAAAGVITPSGTLTAQRSYRVNIGGILSDEFTLASGADVADAVAAVVAAINAKLEMPVVAANAGPDTSVTLTAKWKGATGNDITIEVVGDVDAGMTFGITDMVNGATNPTVDAALAQIGDVWETMVINGLNISDTTALGTYSTFGEGRWSTLVRKPLVVFTGVTTTSSSSATSVSVARTTDRVNAQLVAPGSPHLPCMVAARQVARIARVANNNPPVDYGAQIVDGITPGTDGEQWNYTDRNTAVKAGSSTVKVSGGQLLIDDVVTFYAPSGDPLPAYRYVVDIVRLQNIIFNIALVFEAQEWVAAPLIPDAQPTTNSAARKPRHAVAALRALIGSLALEAIISDPETAKEATTATIDSENPKRLNITTNVSLSGNTNIKNVDLNFGFFFGAPALAA